jgi:hypothetical protein
MPQEIISVTSGQPIPYSFRKITYRQFRKAIDLLEDSRTAQRESRDAIVDQAAEILIDGSKLLMDEATNTDVQAVLTAAIEYNQGSEADAKKSA